MTAPTKLNPDRISRLYLIRKDASDRVQISGGRVKVGGEVRFIKDRSDDAGQWAFSPPGASKREITNDFEYSHRNLKPLAKCFRATNSALGFALSAYNIFAKMQSRKVSGDGLLGGKGYVQKITDMRRQYMNIVEALSSMSDTLKDELDAPHWTEVSRKLPNTDEVSEDLEEAEEIKENPEAWADSEMEE